MSIAERADVEDDWFAIQVHAGRERVSAAHLRASGYDVFLPCCRVQRQWSDRVKFIEQALFAGYLFCRVRLDVTSKIVTTPGVIRMVGDGQRPLPVPLYEIEALQRVVATGLYLTPWRFLEAGQPVHIIDGPLRGIEGIVVRVDNRDQLVLSISLLRRSVAVEIDPRWVSIPPTLARVPVGPADRAGARPRA